jgi:fatty acid desaturase
MDVKALRRDLEAAGVFEKQEGRSWRKLALLAVVFAGMVAAHLVMPLWGVLLLLPFTSVVAVTIAMLGHEGGHRALSHSQFRNELMIHLTFTAFSGLGTNYWRYKHNVKHHSHTNIDGEDPDLNLWPMASSAAQHRESVPARRWFQRNLQGFMFWPLTLFLSWSMRASGIEYLVRYARERGVDRRWALDVACLVTHLTCWVILPSIFISPLAILFYLGVWTLAGPMLAAIFAPAHMSMPVLTGHHDKWRLQFETTRNLAMPAWLSWFFIGLDYQLEHHLFPRIPHQNMKMASAVTRAWAAREGVPYYEVNYVTGLRDVTRYMAVAWRLDPTDPDHQAQWNMQRSEHDLAAPNAPLSKHTPILLGEPSAV